MTAKWLAEDTEDSTPPAEVTDLKVHLENNIPVLTWINPPDEDFKTVIVTYYKNNSSTTLGGHASSVQESRILLICKKLCMMLINILLQFRL